MTDRTPQQTADHVRDGMWAADTACQALGMRVLQVTPGAAVVEMPVRADMLNGHAICHGGLITTLADSTFAFACNSYNELTVASGFAIDLLAPGRLGDVLTATAREHTLVGRNGIFYDRDGNEWDALVVDLIVNPISLWEAAIAPFVRLRDFIGDKIEKFAASKADAAESSAKESATKKEDALKKAADAPPGGAKAAAKPPEPENPANTTNLVIGLSLAFAALTSTLAVIIKAVMDTDSGKLVSGLALVVLCIAALSAFLGYLKLRRRDLSTVLEACGWAMNLRMKLRRRMARLFTRRPRLPQGSRIARFKSMAQSGSETSLLGKLVRVLFIALMFGVGLSLAWKYDEIRQNGLLETLRTLPDALMALLR